MKSLITTLAAGAALLGATAAPALADSYDGYRGGDHAVYSDRDFRGDVGRDDFRGPGDFRQRIMFRIDSVQRDVWRATRAGVIDRYAARRAMDRLQGYRFEVRDGVSPYEMRDINAGLDRIERMIQMRSYDGRFSHWGGGPRW